MNPVGYVFSKEKVEDENNEDKTKTVKTPCWLAQNTRATNNFAHKTVMIHCYNRYPLQDIASYLEDYNCKLDDDVFALSELLQWAYRGCVRKNQKMTLCIGSKRMYELFQNWINERPLDYKESK